MGFSIVRASLEPIKHGLILRSNISVMKPAVDKNEVIQITNLFLWVFLLLFYDDLYQWIIFFILF